ncbi:MAG: ABC transporter permease [Acidobacteria bacterium]|nr:ABC transporter permease [Acidobacteriota bacterium]MBI3278301.1 ABC transporter permease [Acidobacteriota bacterium]
MALPLGYNLRNLAVRKTTTIMTALGIALTVAVLLAVLALVEGLRTALRVSGHPLQILVTRKASSSELVSVMARANFEQIKVKPGIARSASGEPMASLEMVTLLNLEGVDSPGGMNVTLRGISPAGREMRDRLQLERGRWYAPGRREIVVGKSVALRYPAAKIGGKLQFGKGDWEVVGIMSAGASAVNSEIWGDLFQVASDHNRAEFLSSVLLRAADPVAFSALINDLDADQRLNVSAIPETRYYEKQMIAAAPVQFMGTFVALIMAVGSCFAAMNTMYAAVARRAREIGTLRVLGFSRAGILFSFVVESVLLSMIGGLIGCLLVLPLNNITTGVGSFVTFSEFSFNFRVTPQLMLSGVLFGALMGALGGFFPARSAARKEILNALREI